MSATQGVMPPQGYLNGQLDSDSMSACTKTQGNSIPATPDCLTLQTEAVVLLSLQNTQWFGTLCLVDQCQLTKLSVLPTMQQEQKKQQQQRRRRQSAAVNIQHHAVSQASTHL